MTIMDEAPNKKHLTLAASFLAQACHTAAFAKPPMGHEETATPVLHYVQAINTAHKTGQTDKPEYKAIVDMVNHMTSPDIFGRFEQIEPRSAEAFMLLKTAIGYYEKAITPQDDWHPAFN